MLAVLGGISVAVYPAVYIQVVEGTAVNRSLSLDLRNIWGGLGFLL